MNITTFDQFRDKFEKAILPIKNKDSFIDNEIREIESYLYSQEIGGDPRKFNFSAQRNTRKVFEIEMHKNYLYLLTEAFQGFDIDGDYNNKQSDENSKTIIEQAKQFCEYYHWLKELKNTPSTSKKKPELYLNQKLLALHYLGVDLRDIEDTKSAKMLSYILGSDYENTRKALPQIYFNSPNNKVRTKDNLKKMLWLFDNEQFKKIKQTITSDIRNLK